MSSSIFFKFKSMKDPMQITFDGTSLSVFEVKREIINISKLGDGTDFDLEISTPESGEKYDDDTTQIPRSTTVIARRTPAQKPGAGRAARYVTGKMPITAKNQHRMESAMSKSASASTSASLGGVNGGKEMTEEEKLNAMFAADSGAWKAEQSQMANKPVVRSNFNNKSAAVPDKPPPPGYTCFRCGQKGHWIQACPTNNDPNWDRRFKKTTGIPSSMLHKVEKVLDADGKPDFSKLPAGVMVNANGDWMVAAPDKAAWDKFQEKQSAAAEKAKESVADDKELSERGLECPLDKHMYNDPVKTPCCGKSYCRDCIENALLDGDLLCPNCGEQVLLDKLEADDETLSKIKEYEDEKKAQKQKEKELSKSPSAAASPAKDKSTPQPEDNKSPSANVPEVKANGTGSAASTPNPRKRSAEEPLESSRKAAGPAERPTSKAGTPAQSSTPIPTGPKAMQPKPMPNTMEEFAKQMNAMSGSMAGMQNGMPAMMNPMMGMPGMMNPMMGMPGMMNPMMGMGGYGGGGMNGMGMYGGMPNGGGGWNGPQQGFNNHMSQNANGGGNNGAYFRQPINPHRQQGRQRRQRSVDYKQM